MAGLAPQERLQPSLLDRLRDDEPAQMRESLDARVLNKNQLRAAVLRDMSWLFNATREELEPDADDRERYEMWQRASAARESVLNFGIPALSGRSMAATDFAALQERIRIAIVRFEPRIDPKTLKVEVVNDHPGQQSLNMRLVIKGSLWNQPVPLELLLSADVNVDTGQASVRDMRA
jgi:type VI secretion system protein ImpF